MKNVKSIMCFGDSNTYGQRTDGLGRYSRSERWTGILQSHLKDAYYIIEEGLNGRTVNFEDDIELDKCGRKHIFTCLNTHAPLDLIIVMLGTNDLKARFSVNVSDIAVGMDGLVKDILNFTQRGDVKKTKVLLISPILVRKQTFLGDILKNAHEKSKDFKEKYAEIALNNGIYFLSMDDYAVASEEDGLHLDVDNHKIVAKIVEKKIREIFEGE